MLYDVRINYDAPMNYEIGAYNFYYSNYFFESDSNNNIYIYDKRMNLLDVIHNLELQDYNEFKIECYTWLHHYKKS